MQADLAAHDDLMRSVFTAHDGVMFANAGDSFGVAFASPSAAVAAAIEVQRLIASRTWTVDGGIAVRIGIHTGSAHERNDNFYGPTLNETARIMSVGHGGQVVVSAAVNALLELPTRPLGEHRLVIWPGVGRCSRSMSPAPTTATRRSTRWATTARRCPCRGPG